MIWQKQCTGCQEFGHDIYFVVSGLELGLFGSKGWHVLKVSDLFVLNYFSVDSPRAGPQLGLETLGVKFSCSAVEFLSNGTGTGRCFQKGKNAFKVENTLIEQN